MLEIVGLEGKTAKTAEQIAEGNKTQQSRKKAVKKKLTKQEMRELHNKIKEETDAELSQRFKVDTTM